MPPKVRETISSNLRSRRGRGRRSIAGRSRCRSSAALCASRSCRPYLNTLRFSRDDLRARRGLGAHARGRGADATPLPRHRRRAGRDVRAVQEPGVPAAPPSKLPAEGAGGRARILFSRREDRGGRRGDGEEPPGPERADGAAVWGARHRAGRPDCGAGGGGGVRTQRVLPRVLGDFLQAAPFRSRGFSDRRRR